MHFLFKSLARGCDSINILLTGKTGVGKSSIINAIIGNTVAHEGKDLSGVTREVTSYKMTVNNINFEIWDSPGITDTDDVITERIKKTLKQNCPHLHLLLYCIRMDRDRVKVSELEAIKQLSHVFTPKIWDTAVFALTFANRVLPPSEIETAEEVTKWFKKRIKEFQEVIVRALVESGVPQDKAKQVPVIPTGYHKRTRLMPNPRELYDRQDWFYPFWQTCFDHMEENALIPLLASHRVKVVKGKTSSELAQEYAQQQQELEKKEKELEEKARLVELEMEKMHQQFAEEKKLEEKHRMEEQKKMAEERKKQEEEIERARKKRKEEDKQRKRSESDIVEQRQQQLLRKQQRKMLEEQEQQRQLQLQKECKEKEQQRKEQEE